MTELHKLSEDTRKTVIMQTSVDERREEKVTVDEIRDDSVRISTVRAAGPGYIIHASGTIDLVSNKTTVVVRSFGELVTIK